MPRPSSRPASPLGGASFTTAAPAGLGGMLANPFSTVRYYTTSRFMIPSVLANGHCGRFAYDDYRDRADWTRVSGYAFRGDSRAPDDVRGAGGFWPGLTRDLESLGDRRSDAVAGRVRTMGKELDVSQHLWGNVLATGLVSVSRTPAAAIRFAGYASRDPDYGAVGWIYAMFVEGAIDTIRAVRGPAAEFGVKGATKALELSVPGGIDWEDVVAYRRADGSSPVYLREGFSRVDAEGASQVHRAMSY